MTDTMTEQERIEFLASLGLDPVIPTEPAKELTPVEVPAEPVNTHTIPVADIVFDAKDVAEFDLSIGDQFASASRKLFAAYKGPKGDPRNSAVHRRISNFLGGLQLAAKTDGFVTEKIKTSKEVYTMAQIIAKTGMTSEELLEALGVKK